jgi:integrase
VSTQTGSKLASREKRLKLKIGARHGVALAPGLHLVYRRARSGDASWSARQRDPNGRATLRRLGAADDATHPDGITILSFEQAVKLARAANDGEADTPAPNTLTVKQAADRYMAWYRDHRKGVMTTESALRVHILPAFGHRLVVTLKAAELTAFLNKLATTPPRRRTSAFAREINTGPAPITDDAKRQRRSTANRVYNVLRAVLNKAFIDGLATSDSEWRRVKPHRNADAPSVRFLTKAEATRLVNACPAIVKPLARGALATGARYGELVRMQCGDFSPDTGLLWIRPGKSDHGRHVPLNAEGLALFKGLVAGRPASALIFPRGDREWRAGEQRRPLEAACAAAKIEPAISFHELRHTYASQLAQVGVDLLTISKLLGHADTRITSRHYAHLADQSLRNAVALLPRLLSVTKSRVQAIR